uniref:Fibronectin type-III domain-containing protein n=1 Tax=Eucampia antarctica TaxID=49252 RepID=A0A7S2R1P6_9STRA|mmetsp:Transcript_1335/g.1270  ORF Transcript_1335/g.1270 Transcript_1335/m.1270 type:complete len:107 (+) Transcript_1335:93-413(+)
MTIPSPPKPTLIEATETVISVDVQLDASVQIYELKWKDYAAISWDSKQVEFTTSDGKINVEVTNLNPGTTYCLKLVAEGKEEGPELIVDTETIGCTPKQKTCCTVQ